MKHRLTAKAAALVCLALAVLLFQPNVSSQTASEKPTVIRASIAHGRTVYTVDSKSADQTVDNNILALLENIQSRYGMGHPVFVYLDPDVPVGDIWSLNDTAGKAQLNNLRFFVHFRENNVMTEIKWSKFSPFTTILPAQ